ncbi:unnamed protein product, partial [Iphiclides podalirius]
MEGGFPNGDGGRGAALGVRGCARRTHPIGCAACVSAYSPCRVRAFARSPVTLRPPRQTDVLPSASTEVRAPAFPVTVVFHAYWD